jgi:hypothetical protein
MMEEIKTLRTLLPAEDKRTLQPLEEGSGKEIRRKISLACTVSEKEDQGLTPEIQPLSLTVGLTSYPGSNALERRRAQDVQHHILEVMLWKDAVHKMCNWRTTVSI